LPQSCCLATSLVRISANCKVMCKGIAAEQEGY
jgi:hypothetical protein